MRWDKYYHLPEIETIRQKILDTYTNKLVFLEGPHEYYLDGVQYTCVSDVTHRYKPTTSEQMAEGCVRKWQRDQDPSYKYYGMSKEEILAQWKVISDDACDFGTNVHAFGESMFYFMTDQPEKILDECKGQFSTGKPVPLNPHEEAVVKFWDEIPDNMVPVLAETKVFNKVGTPYAGTFDILFYYVDEPNSPNNGLMVWDYKTNKDLRKNFKEQKLLWPFNDMLDMNESYYTLQLGLYSIPLENLGYKIIARRLIWLRPDGTYERVKIPLITQRLRDALDIPSAEEIMKLNIL
jgi:hypothetical protein